MSGVDTVCVDCGMPYQNAAEAVDCRFCLQQEREFWPERFDAEGNRIPWDERLPRHAPRPNDDYEYSITGFGAGNRYTVPDDSLAGTLERLKTYQQWAPESRVVRRRKVGHWEPLENGGTA